jgi:hypothetical protein
MTSSKMDEPEDAATNARRMQRLWDEEVKNGVYV